MPSTKARGSRRLRWLWGPGSTLRPFLPGSHDAATTTPAFTFTAALVIAMRVAATAAACLAGLAVAAPTPPSSPFEAAYEWAVTGWTAICTTGNGCVYGFNIRGPAADETATAPARPAFEAKCTGYNSTGPETDYHECERTAGDFAGHITSRLHQPPELLGVNTVAPLEVGLIFADPKGQPYVFLAPAPGVPCANAPCYVQQYLLQRYGLRQHELQRQPR